MQYQPRNHTTIAQRDGLQLVAIITVLDQHGHRAIANELTADYLRDTSRVKDILRTAERRLRELGLE